MRLIVNDLFKCDKKITVTCLECIMIYNKSFQEIYSCCRDYKSNNNLRDHKGGPANSIYESDRATFPRRIQQISITISNNLFYINLFMIF